MPEHVPQIFHAFGMTWSTADALRLVVDREPGRLVIDGNLAEEARFLTKGESTTGRDLSDPVLVIPLPEDVFGAVAGDFVIDGWHRIAQAANEGVADLPAHFLSSSDELECRAGDWDSDLVEHLREWDDHWHAIRRPTT